MITIVDYKMGNIGSVQNMIQKLGYSSVVSSDPLVISSASKLILPGVGHFSTAINNLKNLDLIDVLNEKVLKQKTPILGICLGMQLMTKYSKEGESAGLGWIDACVRKFDSIKCPNIRIPHMGWNEVEIKKDSLLVNSIESPSRFYFVHSYYVECDKQDDILYQTNYGSEFVSAFSKENIYGVQFHPEKSHDFGLSLFKNFIEKC
jgi:glutamine amidotransferase